MWSHLNWRHLRIKVDFVRDRLSIERSYTGEGFEGRGYICDPKSDKVGSLFKSSVEIR